MTITATPSPSRIRILVAEDEPEIRELISFFLSSEFNAEVVEVENGLQAKQILETDPHFQIVVSDYNMPEMNGGELLQYMRNANLAIKFILVSAVNPKTAASLKNVTPDAIAEKPLFTDPLQAAVQKIISELQTPLQPRSEYARASIHHLFRFGSVPYPIYARLSEEKYVKVLHENDFFGTDELERFKGKHITHLYLESEHAKSFFKKQMDAFLTLLQNKSLSPDEQIAINDDLTAAIQDMASSFGFSEQLEYATKAAVELALKTINSNPTLRSLLKNIKLDSGSYLTIHSSRLPYLANHITKMMGWDSETTAYKMALASLLHDSTLKNPIHAKYEKESDLLQHAGADLTKHDRSIFLDHPLKAAEIASQFKGIPPDVDIIIAQHHETCDGTGFPFKLNHTRIAPLSCAFIVAHDLLCFYEHAGDQFKIEDFISAKEEKYFAGHFKRILLELILFKMD